MAEESLIPSNIFDLGIENSAVYGNLQEAEDFLAGSDSVVPKKELEKIDTKKKEEPKKETPKEEEKGPDGEELAEDFLGKEEEEETKETPKKTLKDAMTEEEEDNPYKAFTADLYKEGVLDTVDGEEPQLPETPEELKSLLLKDAQVKSIAWLEGFLGRFDEKNNELFQAIFIDGVSPKDYLPAYNEIIDLEGLDLEQEHNQELVVRMSLKEAGFSPENIDKKILRFKNSADLEEEAKMVAPLLIEARKDALEQKTQAEAEKQKNIVAADNQYRDSISKILSDKIKDKNIDGIPLTQQDAKDAFDFLYTKKWKTASGELLTDFDAFILDTKKPENHATRVKIALLAKNKFDFSKIEKKAITKESNTVFHSLVKKEKKSNTPPVNNWV